MVVAAFLTEKGGVGKTSVTLGMASAARAAGKRVLVVDTDPQGSATFVLTGAVDTTGALPAAMDAAKPGAAAQAAVETRWSGVDLVPAGPELRDWKPQGNARVQATKLERALRGVDGYDAILIDCPPGLGMAAVNALAAAQRAVMVTELSALSIQSIAPVADLVDDVWDRYNKELDLAGVMVNRVPPRSNEADAQYEALARIVGRRSIWKPAIPARVAVNEAAAAGRPIHDLKSRAADVIEAYDKAWRRLNR